MLCFELDSQWVWIFIEFLDVLVKYSSKKLGLPVIKFCYLEGGRNVQHMDMTK